jgi:hypothetical protein
LVFVAGAAAAGWMTHRDKADGFQVASPSTWIVLPHSKAAALRLAAALTRQGKAHQAGLVRSYATDGWQNTPTRVFDAVVYPAPAVSPIATDVLIDRRPLPPGTKADASTLRAAGNGIFDSLKSSSGVKMGTKKPLFVSLSGGNAAFMYGTVVASGFGGLKTGFLSYFLLGHGFIWQVELRTDSRYLGSTTPNFLRVAESFRMT